MDPVRQQLSILGQNRLRRAVAITAALIESFGDDSDTLMLEALALLSERGINRAIPESVRRELELAALVSWDRLSTPARSIARRQHQSILRRILDSAFADPAAPVRRRAIELARHLAAERDPRAIALLERGVQDHSPENARAAAEAIANAIARVGLSDPNADRVLVSALRTWETHRCESILAIAAEHADRPTPELRAWLEDEPAPLASAHAADDPEPSDARRPLDESTIQWSDPSAPIHLALRAAAKKLPLATQDRLIPAWLRLPALAPVAARRLANIDNDAAWSALLSARITDPPRPLVEALRRLGHEPVARAISERAAHPAAARLAMHACKTQPQRDAAAIILTDAREPAIRLAAVLHLARSRPSAPTDRALALRAEDPEPAVAAAALAALARFTSVRRHLAIDDTLALFATHPSTPVRAASISARRLTDPIADLVAVATTTHPEQALPLRAPVALRAAINRDAAPIARSLARVASDTTRPPSLRRGARKLLERLLPTPTRSARPAGAASAPRAAHQPG